MAMATIAPVDNGELELTGAGVGVGGGTGDELEDTGTVTGSESLASPFASEEVMVGSELSDEGSTEPETA